MNARTPPIPARYLERKRENYHMSLLDVAVLLVNAYFAAGRREVGFNDANMTLDELTANMYRKKVWLNSKLLESCLYSCNMLDELHVFWDPRGMTFDQFLRRLKVKNKFNKTYNWLDEDTPLDPEEKEAAVKPIDVKRKARSDRKTRW